MDSDAGRWALACVSRTGTAAMAMLATNQSRAARSFDVAHVSTLPK